MHPQEIEISEAPIRLVHLKLDDATIKDLNLRLGITVEGREVIVRFPTYGQWDTYIEDMALLFLTIAQVSDDIRIPDLGDLPIEQFKHWSLAMSVVLKFKDVRALVEKIFFTYLRPLVPSLPKDTDIPQWLRDNMDMSYLFIMFSSILHVENWFKKKAYQMLQATFPSLLPQSSNPTSQKSPTAALPNFATGAAFTFDS